MKIFSVLIPVLLVVSSGTVLPVPRQQEDQHIQEFVEVVNVEVIVRALRKGKPVSGLKESDFALFENGKQQKITSFMEIKRKIGVGTEETVVKDSPKKPKRRVFFLYFRISEPSPQFHDALDYFFEHVYREGDYVLMIIDNHAFKITRHHQLAEAVKSVKAKLDEVSRRIKSEKDIILRELDDLFRNFQTEFRQNEMRNLPQRTLIDRLISQYRTAWDQYKFKYANIDVDKLTALAASLKNVELEKWGIVFYQHDTFPLLNPESIFSEDEESFKYIMEIRKAFTAFDREMQQPIRALDFLKTIQQAFIDANTTFHLLLSGSRSAGQLESVYLKTGRIYSDWKETFRNISTSTGGDIRDGNILKESLGLAINKEDIYYRLTFAPQTYDNTTRKIEIKLNKKGPELYYVQRLLLQRVETIKINDFSFDRSTLKFVLDRYRMFFDGTRSTGDLEVRLTAVDAKGEMSTLKRDLAPDTGKVLVSMKLDFPVGGNYTMVVEALDRQTGESDVYSRRITVPKTLNPKELEGILVTTVHKKDPGIYSRKNKLKSILQKSAQYCEKLKRTTFYFTCREEITDQLTRKGKTERDKLFSYDYQIVMHENGKMDERRELIRAAGTGKKKKKRLREKEKRENEARSLLITNFYSRYSFLLPITLLSRENQGKYHFQLLAKEKIGNRDTYKIGVDPRKKGTGEVNHGVVWLDVEDGSVVRIELNPRSLRGIERLQARAGRKGTRLKLTDVHWYDVKKKGIRFPSRTEIRRLFLAKQGDDPAPTRMEHALTVFSYRNYRFFNVNVSVVESGMNK